jgi:hypothetical protein
MSGNNLENKIEVVTNFTPNYPTMHSYIADWNGNGTALIPKDKI